MNVIEIQNLTRDYGHHKGIFDINISIPRGEVFGFLGPNGAGKTTTIRHLMGFIKAKKGHCSIYDFDCYKDASQIQDNLGYLAGEIVFLEDLSGKKLIDFIASMKRVTDKNRIQELMEMFELDPKCKIKKMSKGMKQKLGIICAFMNDPQVIILDEPTSGLDPLMQNRFIELILAEKKREKTIFMSSHIFEEIEKTCDRAAIIKNGDIVTTENIDTLKQQKQKYYKITFASKEQTDHFANTTEYQVIHQEPTCITVSVPNHINDFLKALTAFDVIDLNISSQSLEDIFLHYYGGDQS